MNKIPNKIIGWVLMGVGVVMIIWVIVVSYNIFTGAKEVAQIFKIESQPKIQQCPQPATTQPASNQQLQAAQEQVQKIIEGQLKEQIKQFFPPEFIAKILNLSAWAIFAWLMFLAGSKIAGIGIKLMRDRE